MLISPEQGILIKNSLLSHGYIMEEKIGEGGFGVVYLVMSKQYHIKFVVKVILNDPGNDTQCSEDKEIQALLGLNFKNIIKLYQHWFESEFLFMIFEYCPNGTLKDMVIQQGKLCGKQFLELAKQILEGLEFCHQKGIAHRDIKPCNILFDEYQRPKIADFGLASKFQKGKNFRGRTGSRLFMAPEILSGKDYDPFLADIWALGVTFYYTITGTYPFNTSDLGQLTRLTAAGIYEPIVGDPQIARLISVMLQTEPENRKSISDILKMSIFTDTRLPLLKVSSDLYKMRLSTIKFTDQQTIAPRSEAIKASAPLRRRSMCVSVPMKSMTKLFTGPRISQK